MNRKPAAISSLARFAAVNEAFDFMEPRTLRFLTYVLYVSGRRASFRAAATASRDETPIFENTAAR